MIRLVRDRRARLAACGGSSGEPPAHGVRPTNSGMGVLHDFDVPCDPGAEWRS